MGTPTLRLERVALNLDGSETPDNSGEIIQGRLIASQGPAAYWSRLPLTLMLDALEERGIPAAISNHAGAFLCNHVFYVARHQVDQMGLTSLCGFIHVPGMSAEVTGDRGLPLTQIIEGIECCLDILRNPDAEIHA